MKGRRKLREKAMQEIGIFLTDSGEDPNNVFESMYHNLVLYSAIKEVEDVHAIRVDIRSLRALLAFCEVRNDFDIALKGLFRELDQARKLDVFSKMLSENQIVSKKLEKKRVKIYRILDENLPVYLERIHSAYEKENLEFSLEPILSEYTKQIGRLDFGSRKMKDAEQLHKLRISGKKIKYMIEAGMVNCSAEDAQAINKLHTAIGDYHDVYEAKKLIKKYHVKKTDKLKKYLKKIKLRSLKVIEKNLYYLQQRIVFTTESLKQNELVE